MNGHRWERERRMGTDRQRSRGNKANAAVVVMLAGASSRPTKGRPASTRRRTGTGHRPAAMIVVAVVVGVAVAIAVVISVALLMVAMLRELRLRAIYEFDWLT